MKDGGRRRLGREAAAGAGGHAGAARRAARGVFGGGRNIDETLFEELEVGPARHATSASKRPRICSTQTAHAGRVQRLHGRNADSRRVCKQTLLELLAAAGSNRSICPCANPFVILMAGVNGAGKTTSIGKLAQLFPGAGKIGAAGGRRHLPRRGARTIESLGRTQQRHRHRPGRRRYRRSHFRCDPVGAGQETSTS